MSERKNTSRKSGRGPAQASGELGIGGIFRGLGNFVELLGEMVEAGEHDVNRTGEFKVKGLGDKAQGVYGVRVRVGIGGETELHPFGNIRATKDGPEVVDVREPLIDVFDEAKEIVVVGELPGAGDDSIQVEIRDDILSLSTTGQRRYAKEVLLPCRVDATSLRRTYKNGLLELRIAKA